MILVDTNIWSETLHPGPSATVLTWMQSHHRDLYMPVVAVHELRAGMLLLPEGRRRDDLPERIDRMLGRLAPRVVDYDARAAEAHARIRAAAQTEGRALSAEDGQVLGIAIAHGAAIATRNVRDFAGHSVDIVDPWAAAPDP